MFSHIHVMRDYMPTYVTVTERGMTTIPAQSRSKYKIKPGTKLEVIELEEGILFKPLLSFEDLYGIDGEKALEMLRSLQSDKRREIEHDKEP